MKKFFKKQSLPVLALVFIMSLATAFWGCEQEEGEPAHMGYGYFPDNKGHWVIYEVDSIVYDDFTGEVDTFYYQVKEVIDSVFIDAEGKESLRLERFIRQDSEDDWNIKNVWKARVLPSRAEKTEENITYIKLTFPVRLNAQWDGNAYNYLDEQQYRITDLHRNYQAGELTFDSTVTVLQKDFETLISEDFQKEIYAKGVGMVFKKYVELNKEVDGTIASGVDYSYSVLDYGKE